MFRSGKKLFPMVVVLTVLMALPACDRGPKTANGTPRELLARYVEDAFSVRSRADLEKLKAYLTAGAAADLDTLRDTETDSSDVKAEKELLFRSRFVDQKYKPGTLRIKDERKIDENTYSVTYEMSYRVSTPEAQVAGGPALLVPTRAEKYKDAPTYEGEPTVVKPAAEDLVTTKKNAIFVVQDGQWRISEVQNLKTVIEHATEESISGTLKK